MTIDDDESWYDSDTDMRMPGTVSKLRAPEGVVYLIGTAHLSEKSQDDVTTVMRAVRPHIVCIELCSSRLRFLQENRDNVIELKGGEHGSLRAVQGGEFRRAVQEANRLANGCIVQLIDRPIEITLRRAFQSLTAWEMVRLAAYLNASSSTMTVEKMEALKRRGAAELALKPLADSFPALHHVMVAERDVCMAFQLRRAAEPDGLAQPGVVMRVVGVVGVGHVPGITRLFGSVTLEDVLPLLESPRPSRSPVRALATMAGALVGVYFFSRLLKKPKE